MTHSNAPLTSLIAFSLLAMLTSEPIMAADLDIPITRLQPIGTPSKQVDQNSVSERQGEPAVRHVVRLTQIQAAPLPSDGTFSPPPADAGFGTQANPTFTPPTDPHSHQTIAPPTSPRPMAPPIAPIAPPTSPRGLPMGSAPMMPVPRSGDLSPLAPPQLNDEFATIDNCCCVSGPSSYVAATGWGNCSTVGYQAPPSLAQAPQAYIAPPQLAPVPVAAPAPVTSPKAAGIPRHSLISFGQDRNPVVVGQGLVGQPVAYVPGQRFRNWIRYIFP